MRLSRRIRSRIRDPEGKRRYVGELFGRIAPRYDLTNDVMSVGLHRRWKRRVLELADLRPGQIVLDLAAGTGDLALAAARELARSGAPGPGGCVVAADLTPEMLRVGRSRRGAERVLWVRGDALSLPLAPGSVDRVVIGYGLRNFSDLAGGLREIYRCLRPGGRLVTLDFAKPQERWLRQAYLRYLDLSTRAVGWILHRDAEAYAYIPESLRAYPEQEAVAGLMRHIGFVRCGHLELLWGTMAIHFGERPADPRRTPTATG